MLLHTSSLPRCQAAGHVKSTVSIHVPASPRLVPSCHHGSAAPVSPRRWTPPSVSCPAVLEAARPGQQERLEGAVPELCPGLTIVIAGAGISGLTLALSLLKKGVKCQVLERDLTAIRGEGKIRGPIQVQSNALAALEAIDPVVADDIMAHGCITGDRINGLCDGVSGDWYVKFDTFHPAVERGLPVTRVINRVTLQQLLAEAVIRLGGEDMILGGCHVTAYEEFVDRASGKQQVAAILEDGRRFEGDLLVGTDGIWSKIRQQMIGDAPAHYSEYTCYTGISEYVPADIDVVGYRVFLGNRQYFVSSDVGEGRMQWYAFHQEPAGGQDTLGQRKARLLQLFGHWNYNVVDLIRATPEEDVLRRDIYDRAPIFKWAQGRVALMGDSAHAMQPNLGQGGCMAMEDAFQLANDIAAMAEKAGQQGALGPLAVQQCLRRYQDQRIMRVSAIHGMAGMAAFMASTYKAYLGEGLGPLSWLTRYKIPHPGRVVGQWVMKLTMPGVLGWVLGGNTDKLEAARAPHCRLSDKPRCFQESEFELLMRDDDLLAERANADWLLVAERLARPPTALNAAQGQGQHVYALAMMDTLVPGSGSSSSSGGSSFPLAAAGMSRAEEEGVTLPRPGGFGLAPSEYKGVYLNPAPEATPAAEPGVTLVGRSPSCHLVLDNPSCAEQHARIEMQSAGRYFAHDLGSNNGTWVNGHRLEKGERAMLHPGDVLRFGRQGSEVFTVKLQHTSYRNAEVRGDCYQRINRGAMVQAA
uniref:Zeaxanthin epoxidase, chloroplastic n=1 Tax=Haematococcus lacustris TaxID=44745 RepID=A0A0K1HS92_HAELA|nr:zeaxanthin epoxidase [Haematococcus lacustris]